MTSIPNSPYNCFDRNAGRGKNFAATPISPYNCVDDGWRLPPRSKKPSTKAKVETAKTVKTVVGGAK